MRFNHFDSMILGFNLNAQGSVIAVEATHRRTLRSLMIKIARRLSLRGSWRGLLGSPAGAHAFGMMPVAATSEELAAAHGAPFNAQEVIDRAKREYGKFAEQGEEVWRRERRAWRRQWRDHRSMWGDVFVHDAPPATPSKPVGYVTRMFAGVFALVFSLVTAALLIAFLYAFFSLLSTGAVLNSEKKA